MDEKIKPENIEKVFNKLRENGNAPREVFILCNNKTWSELKKSFPNSKFIEVGSDNEK